ncbi:uncharacterized protein DS421_9g270370 [Arachis hypogaea]|nr:uncharacterized protein DS421_9g270370 [Arachis hypogaea]
MPPPPAPLLRSTAASKYHSSPHFRPSLAAASDSEFILHLTRRASGPNRQSIRPRQDNRTGTVFMVVSSFSKVAYHKLQSSEEKVSGGIS